MGANKITISQLPKFAQDLFIMTLQTISHIKNGHINGDMYNMSIPKLGILWIAP